MPRSNFIGFSGPNGDYSARSLVTTVDEWLRMAGLPTYSELEERLRAHGSGSDSPQLMETLPEPPEFESLVPEKLPDLPMVLPEMSHWPVSRIRLSDVQKLILQRGVTGFRKKGAFKWICEQGEVKRDYLLLRRHGLIRSVRVSPFLAVAFATDEGRRALEEDADRF